MRQTTVRMHITVAAWAANKSRYMTPCQILCDTLFPLLFSKFSHALIYVFELINWNLKWWYVIHVLAVMEVQRIVQHSHGTNAWHAIFPLSQVYD